MTPRRSPLPPLLLLLASLSAPALAAGCASAPPPGVQRIEPGGTAEIDGRAYRLLQVEGDFVLMRYRQPGEDGGAITGFVDEVLRVPRADLGTGRWYPADRSSGLCLRWLGLDSFELSRDPVEPDEGGVVGLR